MLYTGFGLIDCTFTTRNFDSRAYSIALALSGVLYKVKRLRLLNIKEVVLNEIKY